MYYFIVNPKARRGIGQKVWNRLEQVISTVYRFDTRRILREE